MVQIPLPAFWEIGVAWTILRALGARDESSNLSFPIEINSFNNMEIEQSNMPKYSTNIKSNHKKAKKQLINAFGDKFVSYKPTPSKEIEFQFELNDELTDEEWHKMPEMLIIYTSDNGIFEGDFK